jgi:hypothetical protein
MICLSEIRTILAADIINYSALGVAAQAERH